LAQVVFQHSCPEYVWLLDADAFIMNLSPQLESVLPDIFTQPYDTHPDVLVAKDCNGLNAGSLMLRNTAWTKQHLADLWALPQVCVLVTAL
jgi:hypothetical protein